MIPNRVRVRSNRTLLGDDCFGALIHNRKRALPTFAAVYVGVYVGVDPKGSGFDSRRLSGLIKAIVAAKYSQSS